MIFVAVGLVLFALLFFCAYIILMLRPERLSYYLLPEKSPEKILESISSLVLKEVPKKLRKPGRFRFDPEPLIAFCREENIKINLNLLYINITRLQSLRLPPLYYTKSGHCRAKLICHQILLEKRGFIDSAEAQKYFNFAALITNLSIEEAKHMQLLLDICRFEFLEALIKRVNINKNNKAGVDGVLRLLSGMDLLFEKDINETVLYKGARHNIAKNLNIDSYKTAFAPVSLQTQNKRFESAVNKLFGHYALESHLRILTLFSGNGKETCCLQDYIKAFLFDPQLCGDVAQNIYKLSSTLEYEPLDTEIDKLAYPIILSLAALKTCRRGIWADTVNRSKSLIILLTLCAHVGSDGLAVPQLSGRKRVVANLYLLYALTLALSCERDANTKNKFKTAMLKLKSFICLQLKLKSISCDQTVICLSSLCELNSEYRLDTLDLDNFNSGLHMLIVQNQILGLELRYRNIKIRNRLYDLKDNYKMTIKTETGTAVVNFTCGEGAAKTVINNRVIYNSSGFALYDGSVIDIQGL